jgi:predicted metal-dependent HD superfamily phosphohydrolase
MHALSEHDLQGISDMVYNHYAEPHRYYHTLEHLECMLKHANKPTPRNLVIAIALHDLCYCPTPTAPGVNEYYSLEHVDNVPSLPVDVVMEIKEAILATAFYAQTQHFLSSLAQELCDLDLCNLALPWKEYCYWSDLAIEEAKNIYKETITDPTGFKYGQVVFLAKMLKRDQLYYTHSEWEDPARNNMERRKNLLTEELDTHETILLARQNGGD